MENCLKKGMKIASVTCLAMGSIALVASSAAVSRALAGLRYVHDSVKKILVGKAQPT